MASTALAERQTNPLVILRHELEQRASEFRMALPAHISPDKFQRTILTAVQSNPTLLQADRRSFITSCMKAAQDGLLPDGREAALVEFKTRQKDRNGTWVDVRQVQYMPMVYGLRKKILQSGEVKDIFAAVVYRQELEAGLFIYEEGTERMLRHKPLLDADFDPQDEDIIAAYSIATLDDDTKVFEVMRRSEINRVRQASQTGALGKTKRDGTPIPPKGPWVDWFAEMAKKTVLRRHSKTLPMSGDIIDVEATDETLAARSAATVLNAVEEEPAQISASRDEGDRFDEEPHDPDTGEIIDAEPVPERPKRQPRKAPEPDTPDPAAGDGSAEVVPPNNAGDAAAPAEGPSVAERMQKVSEDARGPVETAVFEPEGKGEQDQGEGFNTPDDHPARVRAKEIIALLNDAPNAGRIAAIEKECRADIDALPDDLRSEVETALVAARGRVE